MKASGKALFKIHELGILNAFAEALGPNARKIFESQLAHVGVIQRPVGGFDVNMYSKRLFGAKQLDCISFEGMPQEAKVADFYPSEPNHTGLVGSLWFIDGRPFSIEFRGVKDFPLDPPSSWTCHLAAGLTVFSD